MRFLFASDSFKGTMSSARTASLLAAEARRVFPEAVVTCLEVADGGEGTVDAVVAACEAQTRTVEVAGPLGEEVMARYGILGNGKAIIEMAAASGLPLVDAAFRDPCKTSTYGTGQLVLDALEQGARDISLAIGGSATNDGGMGCLRALGVRFLDASDAELAGCGEDLARVARIDLSGLDARLAQTRIHVMCDVDNPLLGDRGATRVFAPQKGASATVVEELESGMRNYARAVGEAVADFDPMAAGMGAAGGLGAAVCAMLGGELRPGIDQVLDLVDFDGMLHGCSLCVTGEGHADAQSAHGKVISGVARRCRQANVPCVAIVGGMDADAMELVDCGVDALVPTVMDACSVDEALARAEQNYLLAARRLFALLRVGRRL